MKTWVRRLFTDPTTKQLAPMDSHRRLLPTAASELLITKDQVCRTVWCEAPIKHIDHRTPAAQGGPTSISNARCTCTARCTW